MLKGIGTGNVQINLPNKNKTMPAILRECIHAPNLAFTLISVSRMACVTNIVNFKAGQCGDHTPKATSWQKSQMM
jgi:hypothetical protein